MAKEKRIWESSLRIRGYNYIESADYRFYQNNGTRSTGMAVRLLPRYNTNTTLISHSETGGSGGGSRFTFPTAVYIFISVSQDIIGNTDTGYWSMRLNRSGSVEGYHLMRKTTQWDNMAWSQGISVPANGYIEIVWNDISGITNVDGNNWSHYNILVWQQ